MPDFTLDTYKKLLEALLNANYSFRTFAQYLEKPNGRFIILRHDVDARKLNSLETALIENKLGITGTYYFRIVPGSFDSEVIRQIYDLGHETGYHYEDVSMAALHGLRRFPGGRRTKDKGSGTGGNRLKANGEIPREEHGTTGKKQLKNEMERQLARLAYESFRENLRTFQRIVPVKTICMHGSPLCRRDNRLLWKYYDYRDLGIKGEPYFDLNFADVLYLTDTGRRWDGEAVSVRDKKPAEKGHFLPAGSGVSDQPADKTLNNQIPVTGNQMPSLHSSFDIIRAAQTNSLPEKIMITVHPQRWTNKPLPWIRELVWQNVKNTGKWVLARVRS